MGVSVTSSTSVATSSGTEITIFESTLPNVYVLSVGTTAMLGSSIPDITTIKEYGQVTAGSTHLLIKTYTLMGTQSEPLFQTIPRMAPHFVRYSITQVQGTGRTYPCAMYEVQ